MKKIVLIFSAICMIASLASAQKANTAATQPKVQGPIITFDNTTYDYGTVNKNADGSCTFKFTNTGNEPLIIMRATAGCSCTQPVKPEEPIMPGKTGTISVQYKKMYNIGSFNQAITVQSNSATDNTIVLYIKGNIVDTPSAQ